jgi:hypothetical protein
MTDPLSVEAQSALRRICELDRTEAEAFILVALAIIQMNGLRNQREFLLQNLVYVLGRVLIKSRLVTKHRQIRLRVNRSRIQRSEKCRADDLASNNQAAVETINR